MENTPRPSRGGFGCYLVLLALVAGGFILLTAMGLRSVSATPPAVTGASSIPVSQAIVATLVLAAWLTFGYAFVVRVLRYVSDADRPRIQPAVLLISLFTFLFAFAALSGAGAILALAIGLSPDSPTGAFWYVVLQIVVMVAAFSAAVSSLRWMTSMTMEDPREIGLRWIGAARAAGWALAGYLAALPFMFVGLLISQRLFRHVSTPEHPMVEQLLEGRAAYWAAIALAAVVAPIVEETVFRGMLYTSLRTRMGVWPSAVISGAFFAAIHPTLPAGFLPILALGTMLALIRERTGSLVPSMICHAVNNAVALALVRLIY